MPTYQENLHKIAAQLGQLYQTKMVNELLVEHFKAAIDERLVSIMPLGGWPGSNDNARNAAKQTAAHQDELIARLKEAISRQESDLVAANALIMGLEAHRRAFEWMLRADWMQHYGMIKSDADMNIADTEFENILNDIDAAISLAPDEPGSDTVLPAETDGQENLSKPVEDIPF